MVFQNCGPSSQFEQDDASALLSAAPLQLQTIEYRYKAATPVYFEFQMVEAESDPQSNFENFDMIGVATLSDGSEARLNYEIEVLDRNNLPVCPAYEDFLALGFTRIQETCSK